MYRQVLAHLTDQMTYRRLRIASGCVLLTYVTLHFINHALGHISLEAMDAGAQVAELLWRSTLGTILLYGAFAVHIAMAFWALWARRSFRMGRIEWLRILMGVVVLLLLVHHIVGGRVMYELSGAIRPYRFLLVSYIYLRPDYGIRQFIVFVLAWSHACIGIHYWLRHRPFYPKISTFLLVFAISFPLVAILGVLAGIKEAGNRFHNDPTWLAFMQRTSLSTNQEVRAIQQGIETTSLEVIAGAFVLLIIARTIRALLERRGGVIGIRYPHGVTVSVPRGVSVLEASRRSGIPHVSVCGGRGRCSTCRIRVIQGLSKLPAASPSEKALLERFKGGPALRLACQLRPRAAVSVIPLVSPVTDTDHHALLSGGNEAFVVVLFVDIRNSTRLVESRAPYDVIFLLNRFFANVGGAVLEAGGHPNQFLGDGMMALFYGEDAASNCRNALTAADLIAHALHDFNSEFADDLQEPVAIGIGIHAGDAVLAQLGVDKNAIHTAVGDVVHVAARLQDLTKHFQCQLVVSDIVLGQAGIDGARWRQQDAELRGRSERIAVRIIPQASELQKTAGPAEGNVDS